MTNNLEVTPMKHGWVKDACHQSQVTESDLRENLLGVRAL